MAQILQHRRNTTTGLQNERGSVGEIIIDTTKTTVVVMDGATNGGTPLAKESDIPTDISQLTDTEGLLGGGGVVDPVDPNIWIKTFSSDQPTTDFIQAATSVEYDADGNIIALFNHRVPDDNDSTYASVAKFTPTGIIMWKARFGSNLYTDGWGLAYDAADNYVYVAGRTSGTPLTYEFATLTKLDGNNGFSVWSKNYDFEASSSSAVVDVDGDGNPVMAGYGYNGNDNYIVTTKVDKTNGSVIWSKTIDGQGYDQAYGMAIGPANEVVTVGYVDTFDSEDTDDRMIVIKYAADGSIAWQKMVQFEVGYNCSGADADIDELGNIYVCGQYSYSKNGGTDSAMSLVKFNSAGVKQWSRRVVGNCETFGTSVVVGDDGFLYLSGVTGNDNTTDYSWVVAKYNTNGVVIWQRLIDNVSNWTFGGTFWFGNGGGSNIAVRNGYIALAGAFGNPFISSYPTAAVLQIDTDATVFSAGDWNFIPATFSGLLNSTASDITVVDANKTENGASPNATDFSLNIDFSNFLIGTRVGDTNGSINNGEYSVSVGADGIVTMTTSRGNLEFGALPEIGGTSHFHIMKAAGDNADLFLGDDFNYVLQRGPAFGGFPGYGVEIGTNDNDGGNQHVWRFGTDGTTTFPTLTVPIEDNATPTGNGQVLKFSDTTKQAIIFGPVSTSDNNSAERVIIQGAPGYTDTSGEGGDVYVWAGSGGSADGNGGDIKVRGGKGIGSGGGGYLNLQGGDSNTGNGGYINIESGESNTYGFGGDITIQARSGGEITLRTNNGSNSQNWLFGANGFLTMPGGGSLNVTTPPTSSTGSPGDKAGMIAFDETAIYYCISDYGTYTVSLQGGYTGVYPTLTQGNYPKPLAGWTFVFNTVTYTLTEDATEGNPGTWTFAIDQTITTDNVFVQLASNVNSWVKQAWSTTGAW